MNSPKLFSKSAFALDVLAAVEAYQDAHVLLCIQLQLQQAITIDQYESRKSELLIALGDKIESIYYST